MKSAVIVFPGSNCDRDVALALRQVSGRAGETQIEGAHTFATLNLGGSATTAACFMVGGVERGASR